MRDNPRSYPPNLTEFISICKSFNKNFYETKKIENKPSSEVREKHMKSIREILKNMKSKNLGKLIE